MVFASLALALENNAKKLKPTQERTYLDAALGKSYFDVLGEDSEEENDVAMDRDAGEATLPSQPKASISLASTIGPCPGKGKGNVTETQTKDSQLAVLTKKSNFLSKSIQQLREMELDTQSLESQLTQVKTDIEGLKGEAVTLDTLRELKTKVQEAKDKETIMLEKEGRDIADKEEEILKRKEILAKKQADVSKEFAKHMDKIDTKIAAIVAKDGLIQSYIGAQKEEQESATPPTPTQTLSIHQLGTMAMALGPQAMEQHMKQLVEGLSATNEANLDHAKKENVNQLIQNLVAVIQAPSNIAAPEQGLPEGVDATDQQQQQKPPEGAPPAKAARTDGVA